MLYIKSLLLSTFVLTVLSFLVSSLKATIPTGRPSMAPGTFRICVTCFTSLGVPLNLQNCSHWSTGKCRWGALAIVTTGVQLERSKYLALRQCWPRNFTSDKISNSFRPQSLNELVSCTWETGTPKGRFWKIVSFFSLVLKCVLLMNTTMLHMHSIISKTAALIFAINLWL